MKYSTRPLPETEYRQIARNYFVAHDEWRQKTKRELHYDLCVCVSGRRKMLMFTAQSACAIWGIPRLDSYEMRPHCISPKYKGTDITRWYYGEFDPNAKVINSILLAGPLRTICDLARTDTPESLLVSINHCLYKKLFSKKKLAVEIEKRPGMKGRKILKRLLRFATEKCQSPLETLAWIALYKAKLSMPEQQVTICDRHHNFVGRVDMYWELRDKKLVLELDGHIKYKEPKDLIEEKDREDALRALGYDVIRVNWKAVQSGVLIERLIEKGVKTRRDFVGTFPCK
jgi:very-short-patch-repair endonuclease